MKVDRFTLDQWKAIAYILGTATDESVETIEAVYEVDLESLLAAIRDDIAEGDL